MDESTKRRTKRERAVELLYQLELTGKSLDEVFSYADPPVLEDERALIVGVWEKRHEIDEMISRTSREWKLDRIGYVERNILRLALYEINYDDVAVPYAINAAVELAKEWRTDKMLRKLEALLITADKEHILIISGNGEVIEPDDGIAAIGSGGSYALAAARALSRYSNLSAEKLVEESLKIASEICIYTNNYISVESL